MMRLLSAAAFLFALSSLAGAHDDDPKVLDRVGPHRGKGFAPGESLRPGASLLGSNPPGSGIAFPRSGVSLLSWMTPDDLNVGAFSDCWGYVSQSGTEYALLGGADRTFVISLADPSAPFVVSEVAGPGSIWRDIKVYQTYAYAVSEGGKGIQVIDLSAVDQGQVTLVGEFEAGGPPVTHNVAIDEDSGFLYRCGGSGRGIRIYSLANPAAPALVGEYSNRYVHDAQVVTYDSGPYAGRQIAFLCGGFNNGFTQTSVIVLDVTNKSNLFVRDVLQYPQASYSHQAWVSPDRQFLYLNDELDEGNGRPTRTHVIDISDLDDLQSLGFVEGNTTAIGHNLYVLEDRIFEANYRSGLRIYDRTNPAAPVETDFFDTWPGDDEASFNGLWSCYPYFPSGLVIGSDIEKGLFVWWVGEPELDVTVIGGATQLLDPAGQTIEVQIGEAVPGSLQSGTERLWYDAGAGVVEVPLVSQGAGVFSAAFPALDCGTRVSWYVGARSSTGILWTSPEIGSSSPAFSVVALTEHILADNEFEGGDAGGWTVGYIEDNASQGVWELGDPIPSDASPADDHTLAGTDCWVTDLDQNLNGRTSLISPPYDLSQLADPLMSMWLWFSNGSDSFNPPDRLRVWLSPDDGGTWVLCHAQVAQSKSTGAWAPLLLDVKDFIPLTDQVRVRVTALNDNLINTLEAGFDDFRLIQPLCGCEAVNACSTAPNSVGAGAIMGATGSTSLAANDLVVNVSGAPAGNFGLFVYGPDEQQVPLGDGFLCVGGGILRLNPLVIDGGGMAIEALDLANPPQPSGRILAGTQWSFQFWYRDPAAGGTGSNLSDALRVGFCP